MALTIAVIGVGIMGSAIVTRLLELKQNVVVFDIDTTRLHALHKLGAIIAKTVREATKLSDFVILSLNHADIVRAVVFGDDGVVKSANSDKLLIDMSSIDPVETAQMALQLAQMSGMKWLDCPLSGGVPGVLSGTLAVMAGGDSQDFERSRQVMSYLCSNYTLMGPSGAGQTTKLINQLFVSVAFQTLAEAVKLAELGGVEPQLIAKALAGGRADNRVMQEFIEKFAKRDYTPTGRIDTMHKDLLSLQDFAAKGGAVLPMTDLIIDIHHKLCAAGLGPKDSAEMMRLIDQNSI